MTQDWTIQSRSEQCSATGNPFSAGEIFHTLLFQEKEGLRREDLCESAFRARPDDATKPFSLWRSKFEPPQAKPPEPLGKQSAEQLLRNYMADPDPKLRNVRYILAVMLERKRILKEMETIRSDDGSLVRVYHFPKTGEVLAIPDPQLRLDQIADIQAEVAELLGAPASVAPPAAAESTDEQPASHQQPTDTAPGSVALEENGETTSAPKDVPSPQVDVTVANPNEPVAE